MATGSSTKASIAFIAKDMFTRSVKKMSRATRTFARIAKNHIDKVNRSLKQMNGLMSKITKVGALGGLLSVSSLAYGGIGAVKTAAEIEALATSIEFASGSAEEGAKNMAFLRQMSKDLKIDFMSAAEGFNLFAASAAPENVPMETIRKTFEGVSKMIRVQGLDAEKTISVYRALGQMYSKTRVQAQEMNLQLAEALPGAKGLMARAGGFKSVNDLTKAMGAGDVVSKEILPKFGKLLGMLADKGLAKSLETTTAKLTALNTEWFFTKAMIGDAIVDSGAVDMVIDIANAVQVWVKANKKLIGQNLRSVVKWLKDAWLFIIEYWPEITAGLKAIAFAFVTLKVAMTALNIAVLVTNPFLMAAVAIVAIGTAIAAAKIYMDEFRDSSRLLEKDFGFLTGILAMIDNIFSFNLNSIVAGIVQAIDMMIISMNKLLILFSDSIFGEGNFWSRGIKNANKAMYAHVKKMDRKANLDVYMKAEQQQRGVYNKAFNDPSYKAAVPSTVPQYSMQSQKNRQGESANQSEKVRTEFLPVDITINDKTSGGIEADTISPASLNLGY